MLGRSDWADGGNPIWTRTCYVTHFSCQALSLLVTPGAAVASSAIPPCAASLKTCAVAIDSTTSVTRGKDLAGADDPRTAVWQPASTESVGSSPAKTGEGCQGSREACVSEGTCTDSPASTTLSASLSYRKLRLWRLARCRGESAPVRSLKMGSKAYPRPKAVLPGQRSKSPSLQKPGKAPFLSDLGRAKAWPHLSAQCISPAGQTLGALVPTSGC